MPDYRCCQMGRYWMGQNMHRHRWRGRGAAAPWYKGCLQGAKKQTGSEHDLFWKRSRSHSTPARCGTKPSCTPRQSDCQWHCLHWHWLGTSVNEPEHRVSKCVGVTVSTATGPFRLSCQNDRIPERGLRSASSVIDFPAQGYSGAT